MKKSEVRNKIDCKNLEDAKNAVLAKSVEFGNSENLERVRGYDFNSEFNFFELMDSLKTTGFQATNFGDAIYTINNMIKARKEAKNLPLENTNKMGFNLFLGYTSNLISSGVRDIIKYLVEHKCVDVLVTTAGGIEEDLIKCLAPHYVGDFSLPGKVLREKGINRIGNLLVPNNNYCLFEDWIVPLIKKMRKEQDEGTIWSPSKLIARLGKEINDENSICYWAYKNNIPIFCPALTDGSLGDMLYFQDYQNEGFVLDIIQDIRRLNDIALHSLQTGMIILGGGVVKHHICNANLMRNGADFTVYINTGQEYDGSDSGASPDEAVSWGKIKSSSESENKPIKIFGDATIIFPLLVAMTFKRSLGIDSLRC